MDHPREDGGRGLVDAIWRDDPLPVVQDVRPGLDVVLCGRHLEMLAALTRMDAAGELPGGSVPAAFARKLAQVAGEKLMPVNFRLPVRDFDVIDDLVREAGATSRGHLIAVALREYLADRGE